MADVVEQSQKARESGLATSIKPFGAEDEAALRDSLKRCSPSSVEAAVQYRKTRDVNLVPAVVIGVIERFVEADIRPKLRQGDDDLRLVEDLGVDSLTMMEVVLLVEESLKITIKNDELRNLRTIGDINTFIEAKVTGRPAPKPTVFVSTEEILGLMPMQPPFLFVQEASVGPQAATGRYKLAGTEFFLQGHFKDNPVLPASIMLEALGQLAVLFLLRSGAPELDGLVEPKSIYFTGCEGVRCHRVVRPGDIMTLSVRPKRLKMPLATFEGTVKVENEKAAFAEEITLTFGQAVPATAPAAGAAG